MGAFLSLNILVTCGCSLPFFFIETFGLVDLAVESGSKGEEVKTFGAAVPPDWYPDYNESDDASRVYLPPYDLPLVNCLYHCGHDEDIINGVGDLPGHLRRRRQMIADASAAGGDGIGIVDDGLRPLVWTLVGKVRSRLDLLQPAIPTNGAKGGLVAGGFDQVVLAGRARTKFCMSTPCFRLIKCNLIEEWRLHSDRVDLLRKTCSLWETCSIYYKFNIFEVELIGF